MREFFSIASSGENADTKSIPSLDFQDHRSVSEDGSQDGASTADAQPEPDEVVERVEFLQTYPGGFRALDDVDLTQLFRTRSRDEIRATSHEGCIFGRHAHQYGGSAQKQAGP